MDDFFIPTPTQVDALSIASITLGLRMATKTWIGLGLDWVKTKTDAIQFN